MSTQLLRDVWKVKTGQSFILTKAVTSLLATMFVVVLFLPHPVFAGSGNEYNLKAALTINMIRFTTWPDDHQSNQRKTLHLCVFGNRPVQNAFSKMNGKSLGKRVVQIKSLEDPALAALCDIVFYSGKARVLLSRIIAATEGLPILTVGEMRGFTQVGGIINMIKKNNKIKFEINPRNVEKSGLSVSSRLVQLCTIIDQE